MVIYWHWQFHRLFCEKWRNYHGWIHKTKLPSWILIGTTSHTVTTNANSPNNGTRNIHMNEDVRRLCKHGQLKEALRILDVMGYRGNRPDSSTYAYLLQECANKKTLAEGKLIHAHMVDTGFNPEIFLRTKLVIMYAKCGSLVDARQVFDEMPKQNVVSWNVMIAVYASQGYHQEALNLFYQLQGMDPQPDQYTFSSVLSACANSGALEHGKKIHEYIINRGCESNVFVRNALVDMYAKCWRLDNARQVFDKMPERDVVSWNAMIAGYANNGDVSEALQLFQKLPERNVVSWNSMIAGYVQNGHVDEALMLFQQGAAQNVVSWTAMITGYAQKGNVDEALKLFQKMPERDVVSWTAMIAGYEQNGHFDEALKLFRQMQVVGVRPVSDTFSSVLPACAALSALKHGRQGHQHIIKSGFQSHIFVGSALVDMYAKCGSIKDACQAFDKMPERNIVSWNAIIVGHAMHGYGKEALQLFKQLQNLEMKPDHVTFVGVLSACCHAGLVDDGWQYFDCMSQKYDIAPTVEHYGCMVDLLGRAGCLDKARDLIDNMPIKPSASVWGSLLAACRIHKNMELGQHVAERLFELEPENAAIYSLLSNIYAATGKWDDVEKVQKMRKDRGVKKIPGCSWIEVNNKVYSFLVQDKSHPHMPQIYAELERLSGHMKEAGYLPDTNLVFHDVEEEQKERVLCHHSEKLALAFGLLSTPSGTPVQIFKNLRVCGDCHSAIKFISKIVAREIVVRDAHRFHHFNNGQCSCKDYW